MKLISKCEVMELLQVKSRDTLYRYERDSGFSRPVKTHPTLYLKSAVEDWIVRRSEPCKSQLIAHERSQPKGDIYG